MHFKSIVAVLTTSPLNAQPVLCGLLIGTFFSLVVFRAQHHAGLVSGAVHEVQRTDPDLSASALSSSVLPFASPSPLPTFAEAYVKAGTGGGVQRISLWPSAGLNKHINKHSMASTTGAPKIVTSEEVC